MESPDKLLKYHRLISLAERRSTGKGDDVAVTRLLYQFEWDIMRAVEGVEAVALSRALDPQRSSRLALRRSPSLTLEGDRDHICPPSASAPTAYPPLQGRVSDFI